MNIYPRLLQSNVDVYKSSVKLLFNKYNDETLETFVKRFIRDEDPALIPAFELILISADPNDLENREMNQMMRSYDGLSTEKKMLIPTFLYGDRYSNGLKNYELLSQFGINLLQGNENEIKNELLKALNNTALQRIERRHDFQQMLRQLKDLIIESINNQGREYKALQRALNEL
ncbi:hypothetical protein [Psychroflexus tropicus]|uniref:hypothetical protein n=1 Tax=Psychroflexus tropicus TaxID=197345 RepID=UPI00035F4BD2|nr:hypothetical protein [Psychroflexus tropicus]